MSIAFIIHSRFQKHLSDYPKTIICLRPSEHFFMISLTSQGLFDNIHLSSVNNFKLLTRFSQFDIISIWALMIESNYQAILPEKTCCLIVNWQLANSQFTVSRGELFFTITEFPVNKCHNFKQSDNNTDFRLSITIVQQINFYHSRTQLFKGQLPVMLTALHKIKFYSKFLYSFVQKHF